MPFPWLSLSLLSSFFFCCVGFPPTASTTDFSIPCCCLKFCVLMRIPKILHTLENENLKSLNLPDSGFFSCFHPVFSFVSFFQFRVKLGAPRHTLPLCYLFLNFKKYHHNIFIFIQPSFNVVFIQMAIKFK